MNKQFQHRPALVAKNQKIISIFIIISGGLFVLGIYWWMNSQGAIGTNNATIQTTNQILDVDEITVALESYNEHDGEGCIDAYEMFSGVNLPYAKCCDGTVPIDPYSDVLGRPFHPTLICSGCGDGVCKGLENFNNCREDCDQAITDKMRQCILKYAVSGLKHVDGCYRDCCINKKGGEQQDCFDVCYSMD